MTSTKALESMFRYDFIYSSKFGSKIERPSICTLTFQTVYLNHELKSEIQIGFN